MKKYICFMLGLMTIAFMANAQAPQAIPYQAVARNASGSIIASHAISLRISIHDLTATGPVVLSENHSVTTTALGLFNLDIGTGTQLSGTLAGINWGSGAKYIQVELDALGGSTYLDMGTTKLNSVPYALYAGKSESLPDGTANGNTIHWNGTDWIADNTITNDGSKVGIGTSAPGTKLDIDGDMGLRSADVIIATTYNYALDLYTDKKSVYRLLQNPPIIGNFIIAGIAGGVNGRIITLANRSGSSMEIYNDEAASSPNDRIITGTGTTFAIYNGGAVTLRYDVSIQKWEVINSHYNSLDYFGGGGGSSYWDLSGVNISNNNPGNIGIGTTSPGYKLDVRGDARLQGNGLYGNGINGGALRTETNNLPGTQSQFLNIDGQQIQSVGSANIITPTTPKNLYINPFGGNVGIGIAGDAPYKLSIYQPVIDGASNNTFVAQLRGQNPILHFVDQFNTSRGYIKGVTNRVATPHFSREGIEIGTGGGDIYLTAAGYMPALMVNGTNNNVGLGTNTPSSPLSFANTLGKKISFWNSGVNNDFGIGIQSGEMQFYTAGQDKISFGYGSSNSYNRTMTYYPGSAQLGINCLPQNGYTLAVKGSIRSTEIIVETGWADYVFDKKYKLKPLTEVEEFIKANNHLPNIPSATQIQKEGLNVGELQTRMMEKIEELTLYVIELKKEIELLKAKP